MPDERAEPLELRREHAAAEGREPVVDASLVVLLSPRHVDDEPVVLEAPDVPVEVPCLDGDAAPGRLQHFLSDGVAVPVTGAEDREDQELDGAKRKKAERVGALGHLLSLRPYMTPAAAIG